MCFFGGHNVAEHTDDKNRGTDILGLGGVTPDRPARERLDNEREGVGTAGEVERISGTSTAQRSKGATGIDMGAGGEGTDIEP